MTSSERGKRPPQPPNALRVVVAVNHDVISVGAVFGLFESLAYTAERLALLERNPTLPRVKLARQTYSPAILSLSLENPLRAIFKSDLNSREDRLFSRSLEVLRLWTHLAGEIRNRQRLEDLVFEAFAREVKDGIPENWSPELRGLAIQLGRLPPNFVLEQAEPEIVPIEDLGEQKRPKQRARALEDAEHAALEQPSNDPDTGISI